MLQDADEVEAILAATADGTVELDGHTTPYHMDVVTELAASAPGGTVQVIRSILVTTGKLPTLKMGAFPVVSGVRYHARDLQLENDGQETRVFLGRVGEVDL